MDASGKTPKTRRKGPVRRFFGSLGRGILILLFIGIISGSIVVSVLALFVFNSLEGAPNIDLSDISQSMSNTSYIYAYDQETGEPKMVHELYAGENREWVSYDKIPTEVIDVTIAAEDKRFNEHQGVDWVRTVKSTLDYFTGGRMQGGSTITQQVIKNLTDNDDITPERKVQEIFTALKMEKNFTKDQVMETYLNIAFFSNHCYGIQSAAKLYFNKDISELNIPEIATIIAVTNAPTKYNPLRQSVNTEKGWGTGMEENKERRDYIMEEMLKMEKLTQAEYDEYVNYDVKLADRTDAATNSSSIDEISSWFNDQVISDVQADLAKEKGYTSAYAGELLFSGGYRIYSTMDPEVQETMETTMADPATIPKVLNAEQPEVAAIVMTPDGAIRGMIGGREKTVNRGFNRATMAVRHPGSTMKPISAYLNAFDRDLVTWSTTFVDEPITVVDNGVSRLWPSNYTNNYTHGPMTVQYAVAQSVNTIPAKLVNIMTPQVCYNTLKNRFQISTLHEMDASSPSAMALGGMSYGMTLTELTGCYQIFATGGKYVKPYTYTKVTDMDGNTILEKDTTQVRVVSDDTATVLNRLLQTVVTSGTGAQSNIKNETGIATAGKTGSSTGTKWVNGTLIDIDNPDLWYIGLTPYYVGGVWMGYDEKEEIRYGTYPTPGFWKRVMLPIHKDLEAKDFTYSEKVKAMQYCRLSGDIATTSCTQTATGWYKDSYIPSSCILCRGGGSTTVEDTDTKKDEVKDTDKEPEPTKDNNVVKPSKPQKEPPKVITNPKNKKETDDPPATDNTDSDFWDKFFEE